MRSPKSPSDIHTNLIAGHNKKPKKGFEIFLLDIIFTNKKQLNSSQIESNFSFLIEERRNRCFLTF